MQECYKFKPHSYQEKAINHIMENKKCALFLDMGLGKTVSSLTAVDRLIYDELEIDRVLVIAPLSVARDTWSREIYKWEHLKHLKISKVLGGVKERRKALSKEADIYIINRENVVWLCDELSSFGDGWFFDLVILDELSSFKNPKCKKFRALKKFITRSNRVIGLTGTPSPNGLTDLWAQVYLLDGGERLERTITAYREKYFTPGRRNGNTVFNYDLKETAEKNIYSKIQDICLSMTAEDCLNLPKRIDNVIKIIFDKKEIDLYKKFEKEQVLQLLEGDITAINKAALINKLLQFCNGAVYHEDKEYTEISEKKIKALEDIVDTSDGNILLFYSYKHDLSRITSKFKKARILKTSKDIEDWNKGKIKLLLAHPSSAGHGLNLQDGGSTVVWYGVTFNLELYMQANARLHRQGQLKTVIINHLIIEDTVEELVLKRLQAKKVVQDDLVEHLKGKYLT